MTDIIKQLEAEGFEQLDMGGSCKAMFRFRDGKSDVITNYDGISLPTASEWMLCVYQGDWRKEAFGDQPIDNLDGDCSFVPLIHATRLLKEEDSNGTA